MVLVLAMRRVKGIFVLSKSAEIGEVTSALCMARISCPVPLEASSHRMCG